MLGRVEAGAALAESSQRGGWLTYSDLLSIGGASDLGSAVQLLKDALIKVGGRGTGSARAVSHVTADERGGSWGRCLGLGRWWEEVKDREDGWLCVSHRTIK